jgi:hypothetical protein
MPHAMTFYPGGYLLYLHDATPASPGEDQGPEGPTHCATIHDIDYEYQIEMWLIEIAKEESDIVRIVGSDGREWHREGDVFKPTEKAPETPTH